MEELEHTAKQIKSNAEQLESVCLDKLAHLYQDKRRVRKQYQEEHTKIATKFSHVSILLCSRLPPVRYRIGIQCLECVFQICDCDKVHEIR